jgi:tight adherence protein B
MEFKARFKNFKSIAIGAGAKFFTALFFVCLIASFVVFFILPSSIIADTATQGQETLGPGKEPVYSQSGETIIKEIDTAGFPNVSFYISFSDDSKIGLQELGKDNFSVTENGKKIEDFNISKISEVSEPLGVALVIDASGSMAGEPIENAKNASLVFLNAMREIDKISITGFSDYATLYSSFTQDRQKLESAIAEISSSGETALFDGILKGVSQFNNYKDIKHKYLVVLSDGSDTISKSTAQDCINEAIRQGVTIYSVALLSSEYNPLELENIAESTNGELLTTTDSAELFNLYEKISEKIKNQYKVTYRSISSAAEKISTTVALAAGGQEDSIDISYENPFVTLSGSGVVTKAQSSISMKKISVLNFWWVRMLIYIFIFSSVTIFIYIISTVMIPGRPTLKGRMDNYLYNTAGTSLQDDSGEKKKRGLFSNLVKTSDKPAGKARYGELFDLKLKRAGMNISGTRFVTMHMVAVVIVTLIVFVLTKNFIITLAVVVLVIFLPFLLINFKTNQRIKKFNEQLPDTLQLVEGALKAGYSLNQSLVMVINETKPPISEEFRITINEIRMGISEKEALENMAKRINSELFNWVILAVNIQREVGGNLAEIMDIIANTIREKERVLRQIKALTAEGKLSAYVLIGLPIILGVALSILNRAYISVLFTTKTGFLMLALAAVLMIVGIFWILKIVKIDY